MPNKTFLELDEEKKTKIFEAALEEFASHGYEKSSTNQIVKECGISKGSLFKYFENKDDLYFYLIETVALEITAYIKARTKFEGKDFKESIIEYSKAEISYYIENPLKGRFMIRLAYDRGEVEEKVHKRFGNFSNNVYTDFMKDTQFKGKATTKEVSDIVFWVLKGYIEKFLSENDCTKLPLDKLKKKYVDGLSTYLDIIFKGACPEKN